MTAISGESRAAAPDRLNRLWRLVRNEKNELARAEIFSVHQAFAVRVARRHHRDRAGDIEFAELCQLAYEGLLHAIDRYDPDQGVPFEAYAVRRISGSILDGIAKLSELREQTSFRKRLTRERARSLAEGKASGPHDPFIALAEIAVGLALGFMLEDTTLYRGDDRGDTRDAYESLASKQLLNLIVEEVDRLPDRQRLVIRQHYLLGVGFDRVGEMLCLSKGRVSQLHRAGLATLRTALARRTGSPLGRAGG